VLPGGPTARVSGVDAIVPMDAMRLRARPRSPRWCTASDRDGACWPRWPPATWCNRVRWPPTATAACSCSTGPAACSWCCAKASRARRIDAAALVLQRSAAWPSTSACWRWPIGCAGRWCCIHAGAWGQAMTACMTACMSAGIRPSADAAARTAPTAPRAALRALLAALAAGARRLRRTDTVRGRLHYGMDDAPEGRALLWPAAPEVPRFLYTGTLTGEPNFR
jgi:hypothetical protein